MSKRDLLRTLGFVALGLAYIAAVNAPACVLWHPKDWFEMCGSDLPPRLGVLAIGVVVLIVLFYFADKERRTQAQGHVVKRPFLGADSPYSCAACGFRTTDPASAGAHEGSFVRQGLRAGQQVAPTARQSTGSSTASPAQSGHSWGRGVAAPVEQTENSYGFEPEGRAGTAIPMPASHLAPAGNGHTDPPRPKPAHKVCPDCAEEVRFAARKCRFCGYMFETATVAAED